MILFWFGVIFEFFILIGSVSEYDRLGTLRGYTMDYIFSNWLKGIAYFTYVLFVHVIHIVAGYLLSSGTRKGITLALSVSFYEILPFVATIDPNLFAPSGIAIRILFALVILLIISGRKELDNLKSENWRPWKNPLIEGKK